MASFGERLAAWVYQMGEREPGKPWTAHRFEVETGINRGHWHRWLHAGNRTDLPPTRQKPTTAQWATIFARMPLDFVVAFDDYRPGLAEVVGANRSCHWCGRAYHSKTPRRYCSIRCRGEYWMFRWTEEQRQREQKRTAAG